MIKRIYWIIRMLAYTICLAGVFLHLANMQKIVSGENPQLSIILIGIGFFFFFVSYAMRAWILYVPRSKRPPAKDPGQE
ncbi:MAG: hypothetical protein GX803_05855 [Lentisphaerae bacterium]|nr:hypothetical protein [Lentisphaerota bacterium]